jgi:hypothetical protein
MRSPKQRSQNFNSILEQMAFVLKDKTNEKRIIASGKFRNDCYNLGALERMP